MDEGKELLIKVIESKLSSMSAFKSDDIVVDNINLVELLRSIIVNPNCLADMTDPIIDKIVAETKHKNSKEYKKELIRLRDLLIGKRDYKLKVDLLPEYKKTIDTVIQDLTDILEKKVPGIVNVEEESKKCNILLRKVKRKELINDFKYIEELTMEYNPAMFDNNVLTIMRYVNMHNLSILKTPKKNAVAFDIRYIRRPKLDDRLKLILDRLEINYKTLPNYLLGELKRCDVEQAYETYMLIKKNKAEEYGILHLINKENTLARLVLILYSSPKSIKSVIDSIRDENGIIDINILKILINNVITCFISKRNEYFRPKYYDYINNVSLLKENGIKYLELIRRNPLFMVSDNDVLVYTFSYAEKAKIDKKKLVNKCYKTLSVDPSLVIENIEVLLKYNINIEEVFAKSSNAYNILKVSKLGMKIEYFIDKFNLDRNNLNLELLNKLLVTKVLKDLKNGRIIWSGDK